LTETKNPIYWQKGLPKITTVQLPAFTSNGPANDLLASGQANWGGEYIPNEGSFYLSKSSYYHAWYPALATHYLIINLKTPLLSNVAVRKAMVFALDPATVARLGEDGEAQAQNQEGVTVPAFNSWIDKPLVQKYDYHYDPAQAIKLLQQAGFRRSGDGTFSTPSGKPLSFTAIEVSGETDEIEDLQIMIDEWKAVGIQVTPEQISNSADLSDLELGNYQVGWEQPNNFQGPTPFYSMAPELNSADSAPIGKTAVADYARYDSPATDALINQYAATTSLRVQHNIIDQLQKVMLSDVPYIPVVGNVSDYQYDNLQVVGWPTPQNPYAAPAPWDYPDWGIVLLHLAARS
jgi:peptide/nickel transport system substrate-binding protein